MKAKAYFFLSIFSIIILFSACNDDDNDRRQSGDTATNQWIYKQMKELYLWDVPQKPNYNQTPKKFFESLLYKRDQIDGDRFSWIKEKDDNSTKAALNTGKLGFDIVMQNYFKEILAGQTNRSNLGFFVVNVRDNTDAKTKGLKRGNVIYAIDGTPIDYDNYMDMYYHLQTASSITLSLYDENGQEKTISDIQGDFSGDSESPVWLSQVITEGNLKIGYLVYNEFERGDDYEYDIELIKAVEKLINEGAKDLVIDLRYNPGGYLQSATHLASILVPNRNTSNIFTKFTYNPKNHAALAKKYGDKDYFTDKVNDSYPIPPTNLNSLYILTSRSTASASEALINGLEPYMDIIQIGTKTSGKDKGSWLIEDAKYNWQLQPLIMRVLDKDDKGGYETGIEPDTYADEWSESYNMVETDGTNVYGEKDKCPVMKPWASGMKKLGDKEEPLLATAIAHMKGEGRKSVSKSYTIKTVSVKVPTIENPRKPRMIVEPKISE